MNNNITKQRKLSKKLIVVILPLLLVAVAIFGIFMTSQNTVASASTNDSCYVSISDVSGQENCPDSSVMRHVRSVDLERPFYLDRINVILKHSYSVSHEVSREILVNQTLSRASSMSESMSVELRESSVNGWVCSYEIATNPLVNERMFNQILEVRLDNPSVESVVEAVDLWNASPMVLAAMPVYQYEVADMSDGGLQWALQRINAPEARGFSRGIAGVKVGVMEGGSVFAHNTFLHNGVSRVLGGNNTSPATDHATSTAGIIAGSHANFGVAPQVSLFSLNGANLDASITFAMRTDINIRVINASFRFLVGGQPAHGNAVRQAAINRYNGVFVASAGNAGTNFDNLPNYPANYDNVISVGAVDRNNNRGWQLGNGEQIPSSDYGTRVDVFAPSGTQSAGLNNTVRHYTGTSAAAPVVA